eukprot:TRINITY_DN47458_c0_g1_i1.p1 TRINITY_DN47458_c0_g1~~TRINITY_DN47458_c0_g1_i1.p1  ORF type:complete len:269 (-),score=57.82 TRINITY_DN47458_c0_g1_i1:796-1602(-)
MAAAPTSNAAAPTPKLSPTIINHTGVTEDGLPETLLVVFLRDSPTYFRQEAGDWLLERWRSGHFPPRFKVIQVPSAVWKCSTDARGWMVQLELDVVKAAKRMTAGPKAKTLAIASHCAAARLGITQNACTWGKIRPQPAMKCIAVHREKLRKAFGDFARTAQHIARSLQLPLVLAVTAETGRGMDLAALKAPGATLGQAFVMAHRGRDTWIADHGACSLTERLAEELGLPSLPPLAEEVMQESWRAQRPRRSLQGYVGQSTKASPSAT